MPSPVSPSIRRWLLTPASLNAQFVLLRRLVSVSLSRSERSSTLSTCLLTRNGGRLTLCAVRLLNLSVRRKSSRGRKRAVDDFFVVLVVHAVPVGHTQMSLWSQFSHS